VRTSDFDYDLPEGRIAQHALARGASRLLVLDRSSGAVTHRMIADLPDYLGPEDLLLLNDTRVIPARLFARRPTGRRFELLLLHAVDGEAWEALLRPSGRARPGERLELEDRGAVHPLERLDEGRWMVRFDPPLSIDRLDRLGETPLPPYIARPSGPSTEDRERYQTVYASSPGAVAAPTAGLHFDEGLLGRIEYGGTELAKLTLHVGLGTFRPVQAKEVNDHEMHREWYRVSEGAAASINRALDDGRRIVCVGTTCVRALEASLGEGDGRVSAGEAWTGLFITPGFAIRGVGALLTNFHLPRSTLLMLVSAFAGREEVLDAYGEAVREGYRFYSYGDAMLIV
jgi:S-adenosylmethionine:tRNA ribosyltransferase-isomerase